MSGEKKETLKVPETEDSKEGSPVTNRPVSPSVGQRIVQLLGTTARQMVYVATSDLTKSKESMAGTDENKTDNGAEGEIEDEESAMNEILEAQKGLLAAKMGAYQSNARKLVEYLKGVRQLDNESALALYQTLLTLMKNVTEQRTSYIEQLVVAKDFSQIASEEEEQAIMLADQTTMELKMKGKFPQLRENETRPRPAQTTNNDSGSPRSNACSHSETDYRIKLPKRDLPKYEGNVRGWLSFQASFKEIHTDPKIPAAEKFEYLRQSTVEGSDARKVVDSFPASGDHYPLAYAALKDRFGNPKTLKKLYVRELLKLVVENAKETPTLSFTDLVTSLISQVRSLELLGITTRNYQELLYPVVESCIPEATLEAYLRIPNCKEELEELLEFLNTEVQRKLQYSLARTPFEEQKPSTASTSKSGNTNKDKKDTSTTANLSNQTDSEGSKKICVFCGNANHQSMDCRKALNMTLAQRREALQKAKACMRCFKVGHFSKSCKAKLKCGRCEANGHHYLMCDPSKKKQDNRAAPNQSYDHSHQQGQNWGNIQGGPQQQSTNSPGPSTQSPPAQSVDMANYISRPEVLLQTLQVTVHGRTGSKVIRAMIDTGSQGSYILENVAREIDLPLMGHERTCHQTFGGGTGSEVVHPIYKIEVSALGNQQRYRFDISGINRITGEVDSIPPGIWIEECKRRGIILTDTQHSSSPIQMLIGNDVEGKLTAGMISLPLESGLIAKPTKLGWVLCGKLPRKRRPNSSGAFMCINMHVQSGEVADLWNLEAIGISDSTVTQTRKELEEAAQQHFNSTVTRNDEGRYVVRLPWMEPHPPLPENREIAIRRLQNTTQKLIRFDRVEQYADILKEWEKEGIIEKVPSAPPRGIVSYLPHRDVLKPGSTTPLRIVFDASAKSKGGVSLNACLERGPNLLELIFGLLTRFRLEKVGVIADIRKAFLQIEVAPEDRDCMRFLWWEDPKKMNQITEYRHRRVVFGVTSSPFLLAAVIGHLLQFCESSNHIRDKLKHSFYVDNLVRSEPSITGAKQLQTEAQQLFAKAKFDLRCWEFGPVAEGKVISVLGLLWDNQQDDLWIDGSNIPQELDQPVTKRRILQITNSVFDPMGFIAPYTLTAKLILKRVWSDKQNYGWEHTLGEAYQNDFKKWFQQLQHLETVRIPRFMGGGEPDKSNWSLHVFCDASKNAYATCIFLRIEEDPIKVQLIQAKTRVSPDERQRMTIPRLELMSCYIGAKLATRVKDDMKIPNITTTFYTDSTTALTWIKQESSWATFVMNRVKEIRKLTNKEDWKHIPGQINPADVCSRSCSLQHLAEIRWWEGPPFLQNPVINMDLIPRANEEEINREKQKGVVSAVVVKASPVFKNLERYGNYNKILRIMGYVIKYCNNLKIKREQKLTIATAKRDPHLSEEDIEKAEKLLIKIIQQQHFDNQTNRGGLKCRVAEDGIIRVITRLTVSDGTFHCPAVLPGDHPLVRLLIFQIHESACHAGVQYVQSLIRQKFWIIRSRRSIRYVINECTICRWFAARRCEVEQAPLPLDRTGLTRSFSVVGVDMAGPLFVDGGKKVWVVLFTCAVYRGVHIELVDSMSTNAFMEAFSMFVNRRGRPETVWSDNGRNFVGASKIFGRKHRRPLQEMAAQKRIKWKFICPSASWWGGFYERLIGLLKQILRRVIGNRKLKRRQLEVLLCETENVMNQRPLTYVSDDPDDLQPLTPAHFFRDNPVAALPEESLIKRFRKITKMKEELRNRFRNEYLGFLVQEGRQKNSTTLKEGDVVLIEDSNKKRKDWPIGVVIETYKSSDDRIRSVKLRSKLGEILRPIQRLFPLELVENDEENSEN